jgi:hypothetical protein
MEIKPQAVVIPKETDHLERGKYGPIFPKTPACYGFTIIANVKLGRAETIRNSGSTLAKALEADPYLLAPLKLHYLPETILAWHRGFVAKKFDGSKQHEAPGHPKIDWELEALVVRLAQENRAWGYDRIVGTLRYLGYTLSDQTVALRCRTRAGAHLDS